MKQCIIFSYLSPCHLEINGNNSPQALIYKLYVSNHAIL